MRWNQKGRVYGAIVSGYWQAGFGERLVEVVLDGGALKGRKIERIDAAGTEHLEEGLGERAIR